MKVSVYDTYVPKNESTTMHFDILVEEDTTEEKVHQFGREYLTGKGLANFDLTAKECRYCHMEVAPGHVQKEINDKGYYIIEMENC